MTTSADDSGRPPGHLASIFDAFPPGLPLTLDALELAMSRDTERRCLAALDRALARLDAPPGRGRPLAAGRPASLSVPQAAHGRAGQVSSLWVPPCLSAVHGR